MPFEIYTAMIGLAGAVIGGGISSLTTILLARGEREKYRQERSWDLRRETYTKIIGALDRARAILAHIDEMYDDDPHSWDTSDTNKKAVVQMIEHFHIARAEFHASRLMLSSAFVAEYEEMNESLAEAEMPNLDPPESAKMAASAVRRIVLRMELLAKQELGVKI